jgi:3-hydroxyacyl-CoA dehydrogenase
MEAATEDEADQEKDLPGPVHAHFAKAMIATNTSSISVTRLAASTDRPEKFHRPAFHESGAGDAAGGSDPRHRHQ